MKANAEIERLLLACPGDMGALEQLYRLMKRDIFAFAYSLLGDVPLAEDCVQETFARLPRAAARLRNPGSGKAFVFAVARHAAMELRAKPARRRAARRPARRCGRFHPDGGGRPDPPSAGRAGTPNPGAAYLLRLDLPPNRRLAGPAGQHCQILLRPGQGPGAPRMEERQ